MAATNVSRLNMPVPDHASTPAELLAAMKDLRDWAELTYRELEIRAQAMGDRLPRGTIASVLTRKALPRESTIASFVRACVGDVSAVVENWLAARRRIAAARKRERAVAHVESVPSLADQVEAWLKSQFAEPAEQADPWAGSRAYAEGRLAKAVAQSSGDRWVGLHRRPRTGLFRRSGRR